MDGKIRFWKMATVKKSIYGAAGIAAVVAVFCIGCGEDNGGNPSGSDTRTYTVTFNANGGTGAPNAQTKRHDVPLTLSSGEPIRTNYTFSGWNTQSNGNGTNYAPGGSYTDNANITLYAKWQTSSSGGGTTLIDSRDGKTYKKVTIGTQTWMAENLNYDIPNNTSDVCYEKSTNNCTQYGRLYNWSTAMNDASSSSAKPSGVRGVCPAGWHLPSDAEWTTLENSVGGSSTAGKKLKSTSGWDGGGNGTDDYGFSAMPGGVAVDGDFGIAGLAGGWWSTTESTADRARAVQRSMFFSNENVLDNVAVKSALVSVRCVQD